MLETHRLLLRPWQETDAERLYELASDPAVGPAAGWLPHTSVGNSRQIIANVLSAPETYAVVLKQTGQVIGSMGIFATRALGGRDSDREIGYWIGRPYWGNGYAPEGVKRLIRRCFEDFGCGQVWCAYFDGNDKSRRCMQKCGFTYHHMETDVLWIPTNQRKTEHYTQITRLQWEQINGKEC